MNPVVNVSGGGGVLEVVLLTESWGVGVNYSLSWLGQNEAGRRKKIRKKLLISYLERQIW